MYRYSSLVSPPGPIVPVRVSASVESNPIRVPALLDSASDVTIVPQEILAMLGVEAVDSALSDGVFGPLQTGDVFKVFIALEQDAPVGFRVLGWRGRFALLGRDVLNHYHVTLDGPNLKLTISR